MNALFLFIWVSFILVASIYLMVKTHRDNKHRQARTKSTKKLMSDIMKQLDNIENLSDELIEKIEKRRK